MPQSYDRFAATLPLANELQERPRQTGSVTSGRAELIVRERDFTDLLSNLRREPLVALDTEAASFHRYRDRVYLLQLSSRTQTWIVDPLEVEGLPGLNELLADPGVEVVFHDADYDLRLLGREFGYRAHRVFDTRIAAQLLGENAIGLAALLAKYFQVTLDKKFQRADWSARPLTGAMLEYAATDTRYLPELRDALRSQLVDSGRISWAEEEFELLEQVRWAEPEPPEIAALGAKGTRALNARELAIFRELYVWRNRVAQSLDRAGFRVAGNETLFALAKNPPPNLEALSRTRGMSREIRDRQGEEILAAIQRGLSLPDAELPRFARTQRPRFDPSFEARLEKLKSIRDEEAARQRIAPGVLAANWLLEAVARSVPTDDRDLLATPGIRRWQGQVLGQRLLEAL